jgi:hypothetical protein
MRDKNAKEREEDTNEEISQYISCEIADLKFNLDVLVNDKQERYNSRTIYLTCQIYSK